METLQNIFSEAIVERLGWTLVHFVWQGAVVAMILAMLLKLLHKTSANIRYIISCMALTLIVLMPVITIRVVEVSAVTAVPNQSSLIELPRTDMSTQAVLEMPQIELPPAQAVVAPRASFKDKIVEAVEPALPYIVAGWLIGVFGLSLWHLGGWAQLQRLRRTLVKPVGEKLVSKMNKLAEVIGVKKVVLLMESALVQGPMVVGWLKPVILLPASALTGLEPEQLEAILAHELAHVKRCDYLVNIIQTAVEIVGFYNPAIWWVSAKIRTERENCCDDLAVSVTGDKVSYVRALTTMEEVRSGYKLAVAVGGGSLFDRVKRLLTKDRDISGEKSLLTAAIALLLLVMVAIPAGFAMSSKDDGKKDSVGNSENSDYKITLDNGVAVELVGLGTRPWETEQQWWKPDGTNLNQPSLKFPHLFQWKDQPKGLQFVCTALCKFSNYAGKEISTPEVKFSNEEGLSRVWGTDFTTDGYEMTYIACSPSIGSVPDKTDMRLAVGSGEFVQARRSGKYTPKQHEIHYLEKNSDQVILHPLRIGPVGTPCVDLTCKQENKDIEFRVFAKLKNGETERWRGGGIGKEVLFFQSTPKSKNTAIEDIEDIILEFRAYEWVEFKDVSLKPRNETDVQVEKAEQVDYSSVTVEEGVEKNGIKTVTLAVTDDEFKADSTTISVFDFSDEKTIDTTIDLKGLSLREKGTRWFNAILTTKADLLISSNNKGEIVVFGPSTAEFKGMSLNELSKIGVKSLAAHIRAEEMNRSSDFIDLPFLNQWLGAGEVGALLTEDGMVVVIQAGDFLAGSKKGEFKYIIVGHVDSQNLPEPKLLEKVVVRNELIGVLEHPEFIKDFAEGLFEKIKNADYDYFLNSKDSDVWKEFAIVESYKTYKEYPQLVRWICKTFKNNPIVSIKLGEVNASENDWPAIKYTLILKDGSTIEGNLRFEYHFSDNNGRWYGVDGIDWHLQDEPIKKGDNIIDIKPGNETDVQAELSQKQGEADKAKALSREIEQLTNKVQDLYREALQAKESMDVDSSKTNKEEKLLELEGEFEKIDQRFELYVEPVLKELTTEQQKNIKASLDELVSAMKELAEMVSEETSNAPQILTSTRLVFVPMDMPEVQELIGMDITPEKLEAFLNVVRNTPQARIVAAPQLVTNDGEIGVMRTDNYEYASIEMQISNTVEPDDKTIKVELSFDYSCMSPKGHRVTLLSTDTTAKVSSGHAFAVSGMSLQEDQATILLVSPKILEKKFSQTGVVVDAGNAEMESRFVVMKSKAPEISVTVFPIIMTEKPYKNVAEVIALMLEKADVNNINVSDEAFSPATDSDILQICSSFEAFVREKSVDTDYALFGEYVGTVQDGVKEVRCVVVDKAGNRVWVDRQTPEDDDFKRIKPNNPMLCSHLLVERLRTALGLPEQSEGNSTDGKWAKHWQKDSGVPAASERDEMAKRLAIMRENLRDANLVIFPTLVNGKPNKDSAESIKEILIDKQLFLSGNASEDAVLKIAGASNEQRRLWDLAHKFQEYIQGHKPEADYALYTEYMISQKGVGGVHFVICDRDGQWVIVDFQNEYQSDFKSISPKTVSDCDSLVIKRIQNYLDGRGD